MFRYACSCKRRAGGCRRCIACHRAFATAPAERNKKTGFAAEMMDMAQAHVENFMSELGAAEMAISGAIHRKAIEAARAYGKFVAHPARLDPGDCFVYACARECRQPLLFKGDDFQKPILSLRKVVV